MPVAIISNTFARKIASEWHSGGGSPLYALSSTGAISNDTVDEIKENIISVFTSPVSMYTHTEVMWLYELLTYCQYHGTRGPQDGWSRLTW